MISPNFYDDLHWLASRYADRPDIVQDAGGNISVKVDSDVMLIKASGRRFGDIDGKGRGLVPVFHKRLGEYLLSEDAQNESEDAHLGAILSCTDQHAPNDRPSMEVWFHTLLSPYVLHTHSAYVNVLACAHEGSDVFRKIMEDAGVSYIILPYHNPGFELGAALSKELGAHKRVPTVILLENHGIIVHGDTARECADIHDLVEEKIKSELGIADTAFAMHDLNNKEANEFDAVVLFPDQVIYPKSRAVRAAHRFILAHIRDRGFKVRTIKNEDVEVIAGMESEQHRKNLQKN